MTIVLPERRDTATQQYLPSENSTSQQPTSVIQPQAQVEITHKFHESVGANIQLNSDRTVATRCREYNNAILLSECPLESNEVFEIAVQEVASEWSGSLRIGVMTNNDGNWFTSMNLVPSMTSIPEDSWYLIGELFSIIASKVIRIRYVRCSFKFGLRSFSQGIKSDIRATFCA